MNNIISSVSAAQNIFSRTDLNKDDVISKAEFVSARPDGVSEGQAVERYNSIDTENTNALTEAQLSAASPPPPPPPSSQDVSSLGSNLSDELVGALLQLTQEDLFSAADLDANGAISQEEFVAVRPEFASEEDAIARFGVVDADSDGAITIEEFENSAPPPPPPAGTGPDSASATTTGGAEEGAEESAGNRPPPPPPPPSGGAADIEYDDLDTNEDGIVSMQELLADDDDDTVTATATDDDDSSTEETAAGRLQEFANATSTYALNSELDQATPIELLIGA